MQEKDTLNEVDAIITRRPRLTAEERAKRKKRKKITNAIIAWTIFISLIVLIIFAGVKTVKFIAGLFEQEFAFSHSVCENWPECDSISVIKRDYAISIKFPVINEKTDKSIRKDAEDMLSAFTEEIKQFERGKGENRAVYTVNYSIVKNSDMYVSLLYTVNRYNPVRDINDIQYIAKIYDIASGKQLNVSEIFDGEYSNIVSDYVITHLEADARYVAETGTTLFTNNTKPEPKNFSNIGFTDSSLKVYFSAGDIFPTDVGALIVEIPLSKLYKNMIINIPQYTAPTYDANAPMIAMTFDDGPQPSATSRILDALEAVGGRATFFILGERVELGSEVIKRGYAMGCEYGNHSWNHANLSTATSDVITAQIKDTDNALKSVIGKECSLIRAPYAATNDTVLEIANRPFVGWSIDTMDWDTRNTASTVDKILSKVKDGDILLMHDIYSETAAAVEIVIPQLVERGFQLVTVSELMEARDIPLISGKIYYNAPKN